MIVILLALAIAPGLAIAIFVYEKDKLDREPLHLLVKSFFLGAVSIFPALLFEGFFGWLGIVLSSDLVLTFNHALSVGFSEELSKYLFLIWFAYPKKEFNEPFDGITYGVMIAMGFATLENVFYVVDGGISVALIRMFTAVPAHATFGVIMGYYVGSAKFQHRYAAIFPKTAALVSAAGLHAAYDFCLFLQNYPLLAIGAVLALGTGIWLSLKAIRIHNQNSPFNHEWHPEEKEVFKG